MKHLTVAEHLDAQISFRLGKIDDAERRALLDDTIARFGLSRCRHTIIGTNCNGISGGESERYSTFIAFAAETDSIFLYRFLQEKGSTSPRSV